MLVHSIWKVNFQEDGCDAPGPFVLSMDIIQCRFLNKLQKEIYVGNSYPTVDHSLLFNI